MSVDNFQIGTEKVGLAGALHGLVHVRTWGATEYVSLPILYPSGSQVTLRVIPAKGGFRVDDAGFAYRELESVGMERSFGKTAKKVAESEELETTPRLIYAVVPESGLFRAICDVAIASRDITERIYGKIADADEAEITDYLRERLEHIFGPTNLQEGQKIIGSSTNEWEVSAILHTESGLVVFQAVGNHANSIYRANTAFHDLSNLPNPPQRVAVVKDKASLGPKLNMLAQAGRVIQGDQPDEVYLKAAL
jgi:hypothetical protein